MSNDKRKLTEEQQKVVDDAAASVARAYKEARSRVLEAGVDLDGEGGSQCGQCGCKAYVHGTGASEDGLGPCRRTSPARCGHDWVSHEVF